MQVTITIPRGWGYPRFTFGQRTKQGIVVGIEFVPSDSLIAKESGAGWQYGLLPDKNSKDIIYLPEDEIQQLSPQESEEEILTEIDKHLNQVAMLQAQLGIPLEIKTPFENIKPKVAVDKAKSISRRSAA
ncbi:hypothetical protein [Nostoc sp. FACHB-145]|uniref:hypothetical protein n=1 Tax=Nostoc sp. FACHB-145 TaxID=2692836 RepID=UPI001688DCE7|nr:hypothetical protein [Nostoc sp. FACHB-145]MBD2468801.1 hypothetical protein [Nostoc sp. FACHB-145]